MQRWPLDTFVYDQSWGIYCRMLGAPQCHLYLYLLPLAGLSRVPEQMKRSSVAPCGSEKSLGD
jgi:hypothetical protein